MISDSREDGVLNIFPPFVKGSDTSEAAAVSIEPSAGSMRSEVLGFLRDRGGGTCDGVEVALNMRHQTASARIRELAVAGLIVDRGAREKTRSGRLAVFWLPAEDPRALMST
ncbi:MAG TPA: hypothetical protein VM163_05380 [bacterium]|nr:hypothetical protein [bacterium]